VRVKRRQRCWLRSIWVVLILGVIAASLIPELSPPARYGADKIIHLAVFAFIAAVPGFFATSGAGLVMTSGALGVIAAAIEILQSMTPGRTGSLADFIASVIGVTCGALVARHILARTR
jgi:hypothetical protein